MSKETKEEKYNQVTVTVGGEPSYCGWHRGIDFGAYYCSTCDSIYQLEVT